MKAAKRLSIVVVAMAVLVGCIAPETTQMTGVSMRAWNSAESLCYTNTDTLLLRSLNIAMRYNNNFKRRALPIKIIVMTPDSLCFVDSITLYPRKPRPTLGLATTECLPYRSNVLLNQKGPYTFTFEPYEEVKGIEAIGVELK